MPKKAKKREPVMLAGALVAHIATGEPFRLSENNDLTYSVRGPIRVNGDEFPFHLFRHDEDPGGAKRDVIIAVDPYRKENGKPYKGSKIRPVKAVVHAYLVTPTPEGDVITIDCHGVDWIKSAVPNFEDWGIRPDDRKPPHEGGFFLASWYYMYRNIDLSIHVYRMYIDFLDSADMFNRLSKLPFAYDFDTVEILKALAKAHRALAELKGNEDHLPDKAILVSALSLQEAKDSSEIENIITTHDELYRNDSRSEHFSSSAAKEVYAYKEALFHGYGLVKRDGIILTSHVLEMQAVIEGNDAGFRKLPGTVLKNEQTGKTVYTPPQHADEIGELVSNLEIFINDSSICDWDPLIKMSVIHHQFESIHPFYDGNGRTGRILNVLYLVKEGLLSSPVLYLSGYVNRNRSKYYELLQSTRETGDWNEWALFFLEGIRETAISTTRQIQAIRQIMSSHKHEIRTRLPKIYSQELLSNIFRHPYTKIEYVMDDLSVSRLTATRYVNELIRIGILAKMKSWRENYYVNSALLDSLYSSVNENVRSS